MRSSFQRFRIIFQDDDLLLVDKPSGLLTIIDGYDISAPNLAAQLEEQIGPIFVVHRLDRDTSGLVLFARNAFAHRELNRQFREREVQKSYFALASPSPNWETCEVNLPLLVNKGRSHLTKVDTESGKLALTSFSVLQRKLNYCLLECKPKTGYRHQIRAHLYAHGLGILGDPLYKPKPTGQATIQTNAPRLMLQAYCLEFAHPASNQALSFSLPLDSELRDFWDKIPDRA